MAAPMLHSEANNKIADHLFDAVEAIIVQPASDHVTQRLAHLRTLIDSVLPQENRVATAIRTLRQNLGLTQSEFGKKVGNTRQANVAQWEAGGCEPAPRTQPVIAALAGYSRWTDFIQTYAAGTDLGAATIGETSLAKAIISSADRPGGIAYSTLLRRHGVSGYSVEQVGSTLVRLIADGKLVDVKLRPKPGRGSVFKISESPTILLQPV